MSRRRHHRATSQARYFVEKHLACFDIGKDCRIGVMRRKSAVYNLIQQNMTAGQPRGQLLNDLTGGAVSSIPGDGQRPTSGIIAHQSDDIFVTDFALFDTTALSEPCAEQARDSTEFLDCRSVE